MELEFDYINAQGRSKAEFIEKLNFEFDSMIDTIFEDNSLKFNGNKTTLDHIEKFSLLIFTLINLILNIRMISLNRCHQVKGFRCIKTDFRFF